MYDLVLYGNLFYDRIYQVDNIRLGAHNQCQSYIADIGGIENHLKTIRYTELNLSTAFCAVVGFNGKSCCDYEQCRYPFLGRYEPQKNNSESIILIDKPNDIRKTSLVSWGCDTELCDTDIKITPSKWHHFSYIDSLPKITSRTIKKLQVSGGIVSVDLCGAGFKYDRSILDYVDFIIISNDEFGKLPTIPNTTILIHSPKETLYMSKGKLVMSIFNKTPQKNICVLGAGDAYCVSFIYNYLKTNNLPNSISFAHENASKYLDIMYGKEI